jgi:hypothetical protein
MIEPLFGIVIYSQQDTEVELIYKTIESLKNVSYDNKKIKVIISRPFYQKCQDIVHCVNLLKETFPAAECIFHLHDNIAIRDTECFQELLEATFFVKITAGAVIDPFLFQNINTALNKDQKVIDMFETDDVTIILRTIMQDHYLNFNDYDLATEYIRNLCIKQDKYEKI